jgi:hypothetical protein
MNAAGALPIGTTAPQVAWALTNCDAAKALLYLTQGR